MKQEMTTIDQIDSPEGLLAMTKYQDRMKPKSIVYLLSKLAKLINDKR